MSQLKREAHHNSLLLGVLNPCDDKNSISGGQENWLVDHARQIFPVRMYFEMCKEKREVARIAVFPLNNLSVSLPTPHFLLPLLHQRVFLRHWDLHPHPDIEWTPHSLIPIQPQLTSASIVVLVGSQQENVSIPLPSWQEAVLLKGLLGNAFLRPIFSFSPCLTNSDELVINMAATLSNRPLCLLRVSCVPEMFQGMSFLMFLLF